VDNLQTQSTSNATRDPQSIGQSNLQVQNNNLQGSISNGQQLLQLPAEGLKVVTCQTDCNVTGLQPASSGNSNSVMLISLVILALVLAALIWRSMAVFNRSISKTSVAERSVEETVSPIIQTKAKPKKKKTGKSKS
jgi:hypothetical protein